MFRLNALWFIICSLWFFQLNEMFGQCDIEIYGFNPITTAVTLVVNGGQCGTEADSIGEFLLGLEFLPALEDNPYPCFSTQGDEDSVIGNEVETSLVIFPLNFPGFDIGEGEDDILQTGDTITFRLNDVQLPGSGISQCWFDVFLEGSYMEECLALVVVQINDSDTFYGDYGLAGFPFPDEDFMNSYIPFSYNGACDPPPPPLVDGCTDIFAYNYNQYATVDDDTCIYQGCLDPDALNYCEECTVEGDCIYPPDDNGSGTDCNDPGIFTPNTFTPNNDGLNDYWRPVTRRDCWWTWEVRVYNRWGTLVWWSQDPEDKWLGNKLGAFVPDGVYTYTIKGKTWQSQKTVSMAGHITIFR